MAFGKALLFADMIKEERTFEPVDPREHDEDYVFRDPGA